MRSNKTRLIMAIVLLVACCTSHVNSAIAQTNSLVSAADTSSPRATLKHFVDACNELYQLIQKEKFLDPDNARHNAIQKRILDCIAIDELPAFERMERAGEVAVCIKEILDRHDLPPWTEIPDIAMIEEVGGFEKFSHWRIPGTRITIARIEEGRQKHEYLFSAGTVHRAVEYFHDVKTRPYRTGGPVTSPGLFKWYVSAPRKEAVAQIIQRLPDRLRFGRTFGIANWKWLGLVIATLVAIALMTIVYRWYFITSKRTRGTKILRYCATIIFPLLALMIPIFFEGFSTSYLAIRGTPLYVVGFFSNAIATLACVVVIFGISNRVAETVIASPRINPQGLNAQLIRIGAKLTSLALAVIILLVGGQYLGIPVGTLLASAGIGGVALALGAQDTLKTLFGTMMLMADKPFRVGERIVFKNYDGTVEDIGLRSTRLRLLSGHQVTIPNDELARSDIENIGRRQFIRRTADFSFPLDTPAEKLEAAVGILKEQIDNHEGIHISFPPRVFFVDFLPTAFTVRVIYWYHPPDYWSYLAFSEKFNLAVFHAFEREGIKFALPQRITHTSVESEQAPVDLRIVENENNE